MWWWCCARGVMEATMREEETNGLARKEEFRGGYGYAGRVMVTAKKCQISRFHLSNSN